MAQVLDFEIAAERPKGATFQGIVLFQGLEERETRNNSKYITGQASNKTGRLGFKIWSGEAQKFVAANMEFVTTVPLLVTGELDDFNDVKSLIIQGVTPLPDLDAADYRNSRYDLTAIRQNYLELLQDELTEDGAAVFGELLLPHGDRFFEEFASITVYHDNVPGGLAAHSYKVTMLMNKVLQMYPGVAARCDKDLLLVGIALHDIGKAVEYNNGGISELGKLLSHRTLANEMLALAKDKVVALKGEEWYYRLHSIFAQHHGQYEETPRTFEALIVHIVDGMESQMTDVEQALMATKPGGQAKVHGFKLS